MAYLETISALGTGGGSEPGTTNAEHEKALRRQKVYEYFAVLEPAQWGDVTEEELVGIVEGIQVGLATLGPLAQRGANTIEQLERGLVRMHPALGIYVKEFDATPFAVLLHIAQQQWNLPVHPPSAN